MDFGRAPENPVSLVSFGAHVVGRVRKEYERQGLAVLKDRPPPGATAQQS
jgi:hypothetical protein